MTLGEVFKKLGVDDHKLPPNQTDEVQPTDRGLGRLVKLYCGDELNKWLEDEDNLEMWEGNMSMSDRRILLAKLLKECKGILKYHILPGDAINKFDPPEIAEKLKHLSATDAQQLLLRVPLEHVPAM